MLVTLEAQKERASQQEQSQAAEAQQRQPQPPTAAAPPTVTVVRHETTTPTRKAIVNLTRTAASAGSGTSPHSPTIPAKPTAPTVHSSSSSTPPSHTGASQDEELSASLDQLALSQPVPPARLTPLQALAARPRGPPSASPSRPASDTTAARRLVMGALGIRNERSEEEKDRERQARREHQRLKREQLATQKQAAATAEGDQAQAK